jgi:predicted RNA binding protein YcfA (HicA-like mRNA interferase family)
VGKFAGVPHLKAIRAFEKAGFKVIRQSKHVVMSNGARILTIPRGNPVNAYTLGEAIRVAGLTIEQYRKLL